MVEDEGIKPLFMDDKLYEASRVKNGTTDIQSLRMYEEFFVCRTRGFERNNVVHVAAKHGNEGFIEEALDQLPGYHQQYYYDLLCGKNFEGLTPLHLAAQFGHEKTVEVLLAAHDHSSPFGDMKRLCWLERDNDGDTPLHKALRYGHQDIAILLLQMDPILVSVVNNLGESPAYLAADNFCERFLRTVLDIKSYSYQHNLVSFSGSFGMTVFHPARKLTGDIMVDLIKVRMDLLKSQDRKGKTILHYVVEDNIEPMVEILLKADSTLACCHDNEGMTPLHRAASMGSFPMLMMILELSPQSILETCDHGINISKTTLHLAKKDACFLRVCLGNTRMKELINVTDNQGNTPLHLALMNSPDLDIADALLEVGGINWRLKNNDGYTPMDLCESNDKIPSKLKWLISECWRTNSEANVQVFSSYDCENDWDELFTSSCRGPEGDNIVHIAARDGSMKIIEMAVKWGSKSRVLLLSAENLKGETPLHVAAAAGQLEVVKAILELSISVDESGYMESEDEQDEKDQVEIVVIDDDDGPRELHPGSKWKPWRNKSANGDTPIHKALRNGQELVALHLLPWEPQLAYSLTNANESLIYLAAQHDCYGFIEELLSKNEEDNWFITTSGPHGQNFFHAAANSRVNPRKEARDLWNYYLFGRPEKLASPSEDIEFDFPSPLCYKIEKHSELVKKVDNNGKTPLHYATELGRPWVVDILLTNDESAGLIYDNQGFTPLLRAAANGYNQCTHYILRSCPHSIYLPHARNGRTMLHLAKLSGTALKDLMKSHPDLVKLINEKDMEGNTPLHCAILESDVEKVRVLLSTKGVRLGILNKQHQTPMDLCMQLRMSMGDTKQLGIWIALEDAKAKEVSRTSKVPFLLRINAFITTYSGELMQNDEDLKKLLENVAVAAALLVTLSFAATFTVPGGYNGDSGQTLRMKETSIKVFVASNVVAMLLGIGVLLTYTFGAIKRDWMRVSAIPCVIMLQSALLATIVAFISGVYAVVSQDAKWIAIMAFAIVVTVFLVFLITPSAADVVIRIQKWLRRKTKWLRKAVAIFLIILLILPICLTTLFRVIRISNYLKERGSRLLDYVLKVD